MADRVEPVVVNGAMLEANAVEKPLMVGWAYAVHLLQMLQLLWNQSHPFFNPLKILKGNSKPRRMNRAILSLIKGACPSNGESVCKAVRKGKDQGRSALQYETQVPDYTWVSSKTG